MSLKTTTTRLFTPSIRSDMYNDFGHTAYSNMQLACLVHEISKARYFIKRRNINANSKLFRTFFDPVLGYYLFRSYLTKSMDPKTHKLFLTESLLSAVEKHYGQIIDPFQELYQLHEE